MARLTLLLFILLQLTNNIVLATGIPAAPQLQQQNEESLQPTQEDTAASGSNADALKGVGSKLTHGTTNLFKGVQHFVLNILSGINDVNFLNQGIEPLESTTTTSTKAPSTAAAAAVVEDKVTQSQETSPDPFGDESSPKDESNLELGATEEAAESEREPDGENGENFEIAKVA